MTLRSRVIHLAHSKPELRDHLLPLLAKTAATYKKKDVEEMLERVGREIDSDLTLIYTNLENGEWDDITARGSLRAVMTSKKIKDADKKMFSALTQNAENSRIVTSSEKVAADPWRKANSRSVRVAYGKTDAVFDADLYEPAAPLPKSFAKIRAVVALTYRSGNLDMQDWWGGSGYFSDAVKKAFGIRYRQSLSYDFKDLGSPIGVPQDSAEKRNPVLVYTGG